MKEPLTLPEFPRDEVRAAIARGIQQADELGEAVILKRKDKRKHLIYVASAVAVFSMTIGRAYVSPTFADTLSKLPIIGSVFKESGLPGLKIASEQGLTKAVGETQTINGISVTVDEVLYDESHITAGITIESDRELSQYYFGAGMNFTINGAQPNVSTGSYSENILSPSARTGISTLDVKLVEDMPDTFELGLLLEGENGEKWTFSTPIQKITEIVQIPVNHQQQIDGIQLHVSNISVSPSGISLDYEATVKGTIDHPPATIEFMLTDGQGREIASHSGGGKAQFDDGIWKLSSTKSFDPAEKNIEKLIITPYLAIPSAGEGIRVDTNNKKTNIPFKPSAYQGVEFQPFSVNIYLHQK
ncbi:DUF4179 domain-containing protein [Lysinibacillus sp. FSL R7-0073]|uniref:DUF4179 domain-containing protein n=1 Tax=Lysinibacillus sp. FSL R7-0073 TaxID=2921669 RepID=UPI0030F7A0BF